LYSTKPPPQPLLTLYDGYSRHPTHLQISNCINET
jgi:hypothetical protein